MAPLIERPRFYEGQILTAADLDAIETGSRNRDARHARLQHTPGIAWGLELSKGPVQNDGAGDFVAVTLSAGVAVDGSGREIVIDAAETLAESEFRRSGVAGSSGLAWHPVFLRGVDERAAAQQTFTGRCGTGASSRVRESYDIVFGRVGADGDARRPPPDVDEGPSTGAEDVPWLVLIGFVQWNADIGKFADAGATDPDGGARRQVAGARAAEVVSRTGELALGLEPVAGAMVPAVVVDQTDGGTVAFGVRDELGVLQTPPLLSIDVGGTIKVDGIVAEGLRGGTFVESGVVTDGAMVPLPAGVTEKMVDDGAAVVHVSVTPRLPPAVPPVVDTVPVVTECVVDDSRRVRCTVAWIGGASTQYTPGAVNYVAIVRASKTGDDS